MPPLPPPNITNTTAVNKTVASFKDQLLNKQTIEQTLTIKLTNFNLHIKSIDERTEKIVNSSKTEPEINSSEFNKNFEKLLKGNKLYKQNNTENSLNKLEIDIQNQIEKDNKEIEVSTKKRTNKCNTTIYDKIKIFSSTIKKSLSNTVEFFGSVISGKYFSSSFNLINKFFNTAKNSIKTFFGNTVGRLFDWVSEKGAIVVNILSKLLFPITSVLKWLSSGVMTTIEYIYDKFVWLSKIGWNVISSVWDFFSEKTKTVVEFFKDVFMELITSPIGFVVAVAAFVLAIKYIIKPAIKFIMSVAETMWAWILKGVDTLFFDSDEEKRKLWIESTKMSIETTLLSFANTIIKFYDDTLGAALGLQSSDIKNWFSETGIITTNWNKAVSTFKSLINSDILDDIPYIWNGIRDIIFYILPQINNGSEDDTNYELLKHKTLLTEENSTRMNNLTKHKLEDLAKSYIYEKLFTLYYNNNWKKEDISKNLNTQAGILFDNFKNTIKISSNADMNKKYINNISINLKEIVSTIITKNKIEMENVIKSNKVSQLIASETLAALKPYYDSPEKNKNFEQLNVLLDQITDYAFSNKISENFIKLQQQEEDIRNGKLTEINSVIYESAIRLSSLGLGIKSIENTTNLFLNIEGDAKSIQRMYDWAVEMLPKSYDLTKPISRDEKYRLKNKEEEKDIDHMIRILNRSSGPKKDGGIIAKYPTNVLIAEAGSPELIVPINDEGIKFLNDSIGNILNENLYKDKPEDSKVSNRDNYIKKIKNIKPRPDQKIYDMRNIAHGIVGVSR